MILRQRHWKKFGCVAGLLSLLALGGCGWSPIYARHGGDTDTPVAQNLNAVQIDNIPDREGQYLRNHLIDRMYFKGRPKEPQARLEVRMTHNEIDLGILEDATASRSEWTEISAYTLRDMNGKVLVTGRAISTVGYSKLSAQYATLTAQENAQERALTEVGEQIVNRLSLYYAEKKPAVDNTKP